MVMRRMVYLLTVLLLSAGVAEADNHAPVVSNVQALQRPGTMLVDITYDVFDVDGDTMAVTVQVSDDDGQTFQVPACTFEGDVGLAITSGIGKCTVWNAGVDVPNVQGTSFRPKVIADDGRGEGVTPQTIIVGLPGGATMEMVWIPAGVFWMGSPASEPGRYYDEGLQHQVTLTKGFYLGKYEVTQGQWESVTGTRPWSGKSYVRGNPDSPSVYVSWDDAQELIGKLNASEGAAVWRLPTEAEWEHACRGGTTTLWSFGDDESRLYDFAWYEANAWNAGEQYVHKVGTKLPNPWGVYDMHGNAWEWVQDWYGYYSIGAQVNPGGPSSGSGRVIRGGGMGYGAGYQRSSFRGGGSGGSWRPSDRAASIGFRLLRQSP